MTLAEVDLDEPTYPLVREYDIAWCIRYAAIRAGLPLHPLGCRASCPNCPRRESGAKGGDATQGCYSTGSFERVLGHNPGWARHRIRNGMTWVEADRVAVALGLTLHDIPLL